MLRPSSNSSPKVKTPKPIIIVEKNIFFYKIIGPLPLRKTYPHRILQVPTSSLKK